MSSICLALHLISFALLWRICFPDVETCSCSHERQCLCVQRAKELIDDSFNGIVAALDPPLSSSLEAARQADAVSALFHTFIFVLLIALGKF